ncbi:MAG: substrate-binding domain-containing protein [Spirochaetaceae bacterium]|jgi:ABC-type sugar transport system substrate-binding protein|nr:substrate-binding domain-containing protein [Spirochaetaceae bacterium]
MKKCGIGRVAVLAGVVFSLLVLPGTNLFSGGQDEFTKARVRIGVALSSSDEFNMNLDKMYRDYAATLPGVAVTITHAKDAQSQPDDIENLVSKGANVMVIRATDGNTVLAAVNAARARGVKIVIDETRLETDYDAIIVGEQKEHGRMLAGYLEEHVKAGTIPRDIRLAYLAGVASENALGRMYGITETLAKDGYGYNLVLGGNGYDLAEGWSATKAQQIVENWISSGKINDINVIGCMNDEIANGAITALGGNYPNILVLGVDGSTVGQANIRNGKMAVTTFQDTRVSVKAIVDACVSLIDGKPISFTNSATKTIDPKHIKLMTQETIDSLVGR